MICLDKCYEIFNLDRSESLIEKDIKKRYKKLCLIYHPDKIKHKKVINDNIDFIELQYAYDVLIKHCKEKQECSDFSHLKSNITIDINLYEYFYNLMRNISSKYFHYFDNEKSIINIHIELEQLFEKNIYYDNTYDIYIPLWHHYIELKNIYNNMGRECNKIHENIAFKILPALRNDIMILPNNDILVMIELKRCEKNSNLNYFLYENKTINIPINDEIIQNRHHILYQKGIYRPNPDNIYEHEVKSNIIFLFI